MRDLEFRAWDKDKKKYIDPFLIDLFGNTYEVSAEESEAKGGCVIIGNPNLVIEQYTGLKDKNGKEIYEGDIVRIDSMDELRVGYVELVAGQYYIVCGEEDGHKIVAEFYYYSKPEENCEIIGNIHENPELLEGEK